MHKTKERQAAAVTVIVVGVGYDNHRESGGDRGQREMVQVYTVYQL